MIMRKSKESEEPGQSIRPFSARSYITPRDIRNLYKKESIRDARDQIKRLYYLINL